MLKLTPLRIRSV